MPRRSSGVSLILSLFLMAGILILLPRHPLEDRPPPVQPVLHPPPVPAFHPTGGAGSVTAADAMLQSREIAGTRHLDRLRLQQQVRALAHCDTMDACGRTRLEVNALNALLPSPP